MTAFVCFIIFLVIMSALKALGISNVGASMILWGLLFITAAAALIGGALVFIVLPTMLVFMMIFGA
jgi:hypothetical protein